MSLSAITTPEQVRAQVNYCLSVIQDTYGDRLRSGDETFVFYGQIDNNGMAFGMTEGTNLPESPFIIAEASIAGQAIACVNYCAESMLNMFNENADEIYE